MDRLGESAGVARPALVGEPRGIDEVATDITDNEAAAVRNGEAARVRPISDVGVVRGPECELMEIRKVSGLDGQLGTSLGTVY